MCVLCYTYFLLCLFVEICRLCLLRLKACAVRVVWLWSDNKGVFGACRSMDV